MSVEARQRVYEAAYQRDPFGGLLKVRRLVGRLLEKVDPSGALIEKCASKILGRKIRQSQLCAHPRTMARVIVRLEDLIADRKHGHASSEASDDGSPSP